MSSIIKGGRIRSQTIVNLSERFTHSMPTAMEAPDLEEPIVEEKEIVNPIEAKLQEAQKEAQAIIEEAQKKADEILNNAMKNAKEIKTLAQIEKTSLIYQTQKEKEGLLKQIEEEKTSIIEEAYKEKEQIKKEAEGELVATLKAVLEHIGGSDFYQNTDWLLCVVRKMLEDERVKEPLTLYLSEQLKAHLSKEQIEQIEALRDQITVQSTSELKGTECRLKTLQGSIDYDIVNGFNQMLSEIEILNKLQ